MNFIRDILAFLQSLLDWWFVVTPWEQSVRVRFGKHLTLFGPGIHVKIPFFDQVFTQNIRRRVLGLGTQTTTSRDGAVITINGSLGYRITDVLKLHQTLHDAESSILQEVSGQVQRYIAANDRSLCSPQKIMEAISVVLPLDKYGLGECDFFLSGYIADIPALRLVQDSIGGHFGGSTLSTNYSGGNGLVPVAVRY